MKELTEEQKAAIISCYKRTTDLNEIVQEVFKDTSIDGRSKQGRLVRAYMIQANLTFKTSKKLKQEGVEFTKEQKEFIVAQATSGLSSLRIAEILYPDIEVKPLSIQQRAVFAHINEINPDYSPSQDSNVGLGSYVGPKSTSRIIKKINDATGSELIEDKINRQHKICVDRLGINLNNSRFLVIVNNYTSKENRELFEQEFVRLTWDKPDLTSDELNLYMNVCKEIINLETISKHLNKLNDMFDVANDQEEMSVRLSEIIKAKSSEYHQCEGRIEALTKKLQGDRSERMKNKHKENASLLALVQYFQDEEERANMVKIAEMQKKLVREEAHKMEGMDAWKARILGISQEDVI